MGWRRQATDIPGMRLPEVERAHWSALVWVNLSGLSPGDPTLDMGPDTEELLGGGADSYGGDVLRTHGHVALVEFGDPVAAIEFALDLVTRAGDRNGYAGAGAHVGRVKPSEDPIVSHASRVAAGAVDLAEEGQTLVTSAFLVELGDDGFDRFERGASFTAELDGETMALYPITAR